MLRPFLRLEFHKGRFDVGGMPLRALPKLRGVDDAVRAMARAMFFEENTTRERVRAGFDDELDLVIRELRPGSAIVEIQRNSAENAEIEDEFDGSVQKLLDGVRAIGDNEGAETLSRDTLSALASLFSILEGDEEVTVIPAAEALQPLVVSPNTARRVETAARRPPRERESPLYLVGRPIAIDDEKSTMTLRAHEDDARLDVPIDRADKTWCLDAIARNELSLARVVGTAIHGDDGALIRIQPGVRLSPIAGPSITPRFLELARIPDGWLDGEGRAPSRAFLRRAESAVWRLVEVTGVDRPHVYPTPEGGIQAEWDVGDTAIEVELTAFRTRVMFAGVTTSSNGSELLEPTTESGRVTDWLVRAWQGARHG